MTIFHLPDLGEGLPDAEINTWHVQPGDRVTIDQPLVSMETAKAVVEVPSPHAGVIAQCCGLVGEVIKTGAPLVKFEAKLNVSAKDAATVVGEIPSSSDISQDDFVIGSPEPDSTLQRLKASTKVQTYAQRLGIDLHQITGTGPRGRITLADVDAYLQQIPPGFEVLQGVRRQMAINTHRAHQEVALVTVFEEVDIGNWQKKEDITVRLIQAICTACQQEPALNAWFDAPRQARRCFDQINLGLATDTPDGLFVPVIGKACQQSATQLRTSVDQLKAAVDARNIPANQLTGATFTLSNFGKFAGRFATPMVIPPTVAILAVGRKHTAPPMLPLSLSFDHRAVTGGEATRFLGVLIEMLQQPSNVDHETSHLVTRAIRVGRTG